jgi:O-glycosyl hydrolase
LKSVETPAEGIDITSITIQNEPMFQTSGYPTMTMPWEIQRDLVKNHMGPLFLQNHIYTKILILPADIFHHDPRENSHHKVNYWTSSKLVDSMAYLLCSVLD